MVKGIQMQVILHIEKWFLRYKDGLHLIQKEQAFLAYNFIVFLNNIFLEKHMHIH